MAPDAKLFADAAVAAFTSSRIDAGLDAVLSAPSACDEPTRRVRVSGTRAASDSESSMAIETRALAVARRAYPRIGARLLGMPGAKTGPMQIRSARIAELELPRKRRNRRAVARCAKALAVTRRAQIAHACGAHAMFADPIAVVHHVARGHHVLVFEVDVAAGAVTNGPLIFVLVAPEAARHRRP
jgi:hypothetical protein